MTQFIEGDSVHVEFTGKIDSIGLEYLTVDTGLRRYAVHATDATVIEPDYEPGAPYIDADGDVFVYWPDVDEEHPWFEVGDSGGWPRDYPTRPLCKLVPEK